MIRWFIVPVDYMSRGISKDTGLLLENSRLGWGPEALLLLSGNPWTLRRNLQAHPEATGLQGCHVSYPSPQPACMRGKETKPEQKGQAQLFDMGTQIHSQVSLGLGQFIRCNAIRFIHPDT